VGENSSSGSCQKSGAAFESNNTFSGDQSQRRASEILSFAPRGLSRVQSAAYIGVSPALFDELVGDGRMPQPKKINSRVVWDRKQLDESFEALPDREDRNPWDDEDAA
jgi:predicted DNA-binding transcriptional regulator AlpA